MSKYNSDELVPPSFVDQQFIVDLVRGVEEDPELKLLSHEIKPGSSAGDHYASVMFKIIVTYETKGRTVTERRFILKTMPESGEKKAFLEDVPMFTNEIKIYTETLPAMEKILKKHGETGWWPKLVYSSDTPAVLIFDDLTQSNYQMHYTPLTMDQMGLVIEKLAKYHALSMVIAESDESSLVTDFGCCFKPDRFRAIFEQMMQRAVELSASVRTWPGMEEIGEKVEASIEKLFKGFSECYVSSPTTSPTEFNVLSHGDFHVRNLMFRKDDLGTIEDVVFLDFQVPMYLSPAMDLIYAKNAMAGTDARKRRSEVYRMYHRNLAKSLELYGFKGRIPSAVDVNIEVLRMAVYDAFQTVTMAPVFQVDLRGIEIATLFEKGDNPMQVALRQLYQSPAFIEDMTESLLSLDSIGVFD